ncbi:GAP family protein [Mycobacterium mantenii]|nr:GAP family protein [Mycobacterium mantenii]
MASAAAEIYSIEISVLVRITFCNSIFRRHHRLRLLREDAASRVSRDVVSMPRGGIRRGRLQKSQQIKSRRGTVPAMWSSVPVVALLTALDPLRFGFILLIISRSRPAQNLFVYWIGCLITTGSYLLVPLLVLHFTPEFSHLAHDLATPRSEASASVRYFQIGLGLFALSMAALMTARSSARQRAQLPRANGGTSVMVLDRGNDAPADKGSAIRRLPGRARDAWEGGSLWVAFVVGLISGPPPSPFLFVLTTIATSGAAIGMQVSAAIAFVVGMLAVVEIILVSYLVMPAKTQAVLRVVHDWVRPRTRLIVVAIFVVVGVMLVAKGMGTF